MEHTRLISLGTSFLFLGLLYVWARRNLGFLYEKRILNAPSQSEEQMAMIGIAKQIESDMYRTSCDFSSNGSAGSSGIPNTVFEEFYPAEKKKKSKKKSKKTKPKKKSKKNR